ncbi:MAG: thiolase family protein, partial [Chloroflexota bacterium]|nr:thiolase family protein [Chloroflexota bacterium]
FGMTPPAMFALAAKAHMEKYGTTEEQMAKVAVKNHNHSLTNEAAHFRKGLTLEKAMESRYVATPFKLFDCCVNTDGAAAVILASEEKAKELTDNPMWILGLGQGFTAWTMANHPKDLTDWSGVRISGELAYKMAGVGPDDVNMAELHDCFTISEMIEYEALGFCKPGESPAFVDAGENDYGGKIVTQPRGGLIACGHPFGATSIAQTHEMYLQIKGEADGRQIDPKPNVGLAQTMSGLGSQSFTAIYGSDDTIH